MRFVSFALVMFGSAALLGLVGYLNGASLSGVVARVLITLIVLQTAYFVWLLISSALSGNPRTYDGRARSTKTPPKSPSAEISD